MVQFLEGGGVFLRTTAAHYIFNAIVWLSVSVNGELAQMVERSLSMWEVPGSMPGFSSIYLLKILFRTAKMSTVLLVDYLYEQQDDNTHS